MNELSIAQIRDELRLIAEMIGPGSAWNMLLPDADTPVPVRFTAQQVILLLPPKIRPTQGMDLVRQPSIEVCIPNLFEQIENGRVVIRIGDLVSGLPMTLLGILPPEIREHWVEIPLDMVKNILWRDSGMPLSRWLEVG